MSKVNCKLKRFISFFIIITFLSTTVAPSYPVKDIPAQSVGTLSPQYASKPIVDASIQEKGALKFIVTEAATRNPDLLRPDAKEDMAMGNYLVRFSAAREIVLSGEFAGKQAARLIFIPCFVEEKIYYTYLVRYQDDRSKIAVLSGQEHEEVYKELEEKNILPPEVVEKLQEALSPEELSQERTISFLDVTDDSVRAAVRFLDRVGAENLKKGLETIVRERKLYLMEGPALVSEGIVINAAKSTEERARSILARILVDAGAGYARIVRAFSAFMVDESSFKLDEADPELSVFIRGLDRDYVASNEGLIRFKDGAYASLIRPRIVTRGSVEDIELKECQEVIHDVTRIFKNVAAYEMKRHNKGLPRGSESRIRKKDMPGQKVVIEHISDSLLPTVITERDGTVKVNELFVKILHKLVAHGILGRKGRIDSYREGEKSPGALGNLYESIIYSIALHEIRGHFKINEFGFAVFNPDESWAQGERGKSHLYTNVLAMLFWWLVIVEGSPNIRERTQLFIEEHPEVFRNLTEEEREILPGHLVQLCGDLIRSGIYPYPTAIKATETTWLDYRRTIKEGKYVEPVPGRKKQPQVQDQDSEAPEKEDAEVEFNEAEVLEVLSIEERPMTMKEIAAELDCPEEPGAVLIPLTRLVGFGVVEHEKNAAGEVVFKAIPLKVADVRKIQNALIGNELFSLESDLPKARGEIFDVTERRWAQALVSSIFENPRVKELEKAGQEIILAIETDWIPEGQKDFIRTLIQELGKLEGKGAIKVVRASADDLSAKLEEKIKEAESRGIARDDVVKNVVILAGKNTIEKEEFNDIRGKAFMAGVDASQLEGDSFIRLLEMITMAIRSATGQRLISGHHNIEVQIPSTDDLRTVIYVPRAEKVDPDYRKKIYEKQRKLLLAA